MTSKERSGKWFDEVRVGDTFARSVTVTELLPKPQHEGGVVVLSGVAVNQEGTVVAEAERRILVGARA